MAGDYGLKYLDNYITLKCPQCGETYKRYSTEIEYKLLVGDKIMKFCTYNCRSKYKQQHQKELLNPTTKSRSSRNKRITMVDGKEYASMRKASLVEFGHENSIVDYRKWHGDPDDFYLKGKHVVIVSRKEEHEED